MDKDEIIQGEYIKEAKIKKIITRSGSKILKKKKLPIANISNTLPVIPEKIYTHYRVRVCFTREEEEKINYKLVFYFCILCYIYIYSYFYIRWF